MRDSNKTTRRNFIRLAATSGLLVMTPKKSAGSRHTILESSQLQTEQEQVSPNEKIRIATIGVGQQGSGDTTIALRVPGVELVAVADIYEGRLTRAKEVWGEKISTTRDYREILARSDVDAVIIATPDHWHAQIAVEAMNARKDVYCEKPMVQSTDEGHRVIETQQKTKRILQVGSQRVSSIVYLKAKELLAAGAIGELNMIEAWWDRNSAIGAWQYSIPPDATPDNVDWDRFIGKAKKRPFEPIRLFRWRNYRDYGTGIPGDLFVHLFSGMHLIVGSNGPTRVMSIGGLRFWKDGRDVPDVVVGLYDYGKTAVTPPFTVSLRVNFASGGNEASGFRFIGSDGVMTLSQSLTVSRQPRPKAPGYTISTFPKALQESFLKEYRLKYGEERAELSSSAEERYFAPPGYSDSLDHFTNFFKSVRSRDPVVEDAVFGFRAAGPALLTNQSYFENRAYGWNPETMRVPGE
jgi:predicted dehydrogenase